MIFKNIEKQKTKKIIIWGYPEGTHSHSRIHFRFFRTFKYLGFDVEWLDNKIENLPNKNETYIFITENGCDSVLHNNYSNNRIIFDHNISKKKYNEFSMNQKNIIPFDVIRYNLAKFTDKKIGQYIFERDTPIMSTDEFYFHMKHPRILRGSELLPHEIEWTPYNYNHSKEVPFVGSWRHNNCIQLESLRLYCILHNLNYKHYGRHLLFRPPLRKQGYLPPEELEQKTREAYIAPALQGTQVDDGYIPCRLFIQMSLSVLGVSNNPYVYNLFDDDEVIVDRDIWKMMDKAQQAIKDRKVDEYTKKAVKKVKEHHTYLNRINELFSYL